MLTIDVGDANEAGSVSVSGDPEAGATLTASGTDPDGAVSGVGWVWSVTPTGSFSTVSGATGAAFVVRAADVGKYLRAADLHRQHPLGVGADRGRDGGAGGRRELGAGVRGSASRGDLRVGSGAAADAGRFQPGLLAGRGGTGQVSVKAGAAIDYETRSTYKVAYRVTDNKNAAGGNDPAVDDTLVLTINVGPT